MKFTFSLFSGVQIIDFNNNKIELLEFFGKNKVTFVGFSNFYALKKFDASNDINPLVAFFTRKDPLYIGLSIDQAKQRAEQLKAENSYYRILSTPCLTLECMNYKLAFFDNNDFIGLRKNFAEAVEFNNIGIGDNTYPNVIDHLESQILSFKKSVNREYDSNICILVSPEIKLEYRPLWQSLRSPHFVSTISTKESKLDWQYKNYLGKSINS